MVELKIFDSVYDERSHWSWDIDRSDPPTIDMVCPCDINGYAMSKLEIEYAWINAERSHSQTHHVLKRNWITQENPGKIILDHAWSMERKAYDGAAKKQIEQWSQHIPVVKKLLQIKPLWGFSVALDYADADSVTEIYHASRHGHDLNEIESERQLVSTLLSNTDWEMVASNIIRCRREWETLPIEEQRSWKLRLLLDL